MEKEIPELENRSNHLSIELKKSQTEVDALESQCSQLKDDIACARGCTADVARIDSLQVRNSSSHVKLQFVLSLLKLFVSWLSFVITLILCGNDFIFCSQNLEQNEIIKTLRAIVKNTTEKN